MRGPISIAISGLIGLVAEARHRRSGEASATDGNDLDDGELYADVRDDWVLDETQRNLEDAGLAHLADIRPGDARETLRDLGGPVDFVLIDGWPGGETPTLARQVIEIVAPQIRRGGLVLNDNGEPDYLAFIRDPANGFRSVSLPLKGSNELSVKV